MYPVHLLTSRPAYKKNTLNIKVPITTAADNILILFFIF